MSNNRRKLKLNTVAVSLGCSCRRPKLSSIFNYNMEKKKYEKTGPNPKPDRYLSYSLTPTTITSSSRLTFSPSDESEVKSLKAVQGFGRIGGSSLAVEKESDDPYLDFRQSMLQMIVEKEMYSQEDLRELLNCFLQLNDSYYHGVIVGAFTEIWNGVYSVPGAPAGAGAGSGSRRNSRRGRRSRDF